MDSPTAPLTEIPIAGNAQLPYWSYLVELMARRKVDGQDIPPEDWIPEELIRYRVVGGLQPFFPLFTAWILDALRLIYCV